MNETMRDYSKLTKRQLKRLIKVWAAGWRDAQAEFERRYGHTYNG